MFEINIYSIYLMVMANKKPFKPAVKAKMKAEELAIAMGVGYKSIAAARSKPGFPAPVGGIYDVRAVCDWVLSSCPSKRSKMWTGASLLTSRLAKLSGLAKPAKPVVSQPAVAPIIPAPPSPAEVVAILPDLNPDSDKDGDFGSILIKFRATVDYCAMQCQQAAADEDNDGLRGWLRTCGQAVEQLRKAEQSVLDIRTARKALLPRDDVVFAYSRLCGNIRSKLMQLPTKLSHELVNITSAGQVQRIIDEELRTILESLAGNPFGDE